MANLSLSRSIEHALPPEGAPRLLLENLSFLVIALDEAGNVTFVNKARSTDDAAAPSPLGRNLRDAFPEYCSALRGELPWLTPQETEVVRKEPGGVRTEWLSLRRIAGGACLVVSDETDRRGRDVVDVQTERLAALGFMVAGVCHEVSNPLTAIYSMIQILRAEKEMRPHVLEKGLAIIETNVKRVLDISRRLGGFSRVSATEPRAAFRVDDAIDEALALLQQDGRFGKTALHRERDPNATVFGSIGQMQEVFYNLSLNSVQAMQGKGLLAVTTRVQVPDSVEIAVVDDGPGIPPHLLNRMFEPFFTTKPVGEGTGLGLSICSEIIHEHGGTIHAGNHPDNGACFRVTLPLCEVSM